MDNSRNTERLQGNVDRVIECLKKEKESCWRKLPRNGTEKTPGQTGSSYQTAGFEIRSS